MYLVETFKGKSKISERVFNQIEDAKQHAKLSTMANDNRAYLREVIVEENQLGFTTYDNNGVWGVYRAGCLIDIM